MKSFFIELDLYIIILGILLFKYININTFPINKKEFKFKIYMHIKEHVSL